MAGYSARQSTFTTGDTITAAHSNNEFNAILAAFHVSTGHKHDGSTAGDGGPISTLFSNTISMGTGADTDVALTFNANTNDGVITWRSKPCNMMTTNLDAMAGKPDPIVLNVGICI